MDHSVTHPRGTSPARSRSRMPGGYRARGRSGVCVLVALPLVPAVGPAQAMRWPEVVAALAAERTRAETCVQLLKRHAGGAAAALSRGELAYAAAKADVDAVIAGLTVVLAERGTPPDLPDVETRLTRGVQAREAFCRQVTALVPEDPGTRDCLVPLRRRAAATAGGGPHPVYRPDGAGSPTPPDHPDAIGGHHMGTIRQSHPLSLALMLALLDACRSGGAMATGQALAADATRLRAALVRPHITVLTSSSAAELSREDPRWGHGVFTTIVLEALSSRADANRNGLISISELTGYLTRHVPGLTDGAQHPGVERRFDSDVFVAGL
jgi:hypothetical protein